MLKLYKGNLYNGLEHKIDNKLLDSSQYDMSIVNDSDITNYRLRYQMSEYIISRLARTTTIALPRFNKYGVPIEEVGNFFNNHKRQEFGSTYREELSGMLKDARDVPAYYAFLQRATSKKNINSDQTLYKFKIPNIGKKQDRGLTSYDIEIALVRHYYYVVFYLGNVEKGYTQKREPQHMTFSRPTFTKAQTKLNETALDIAIATDSPLNLTQYVTIMTRDDKELTIAFLKHLRNSKTFLELCQSPYFAIVQANLDEYLKRELTRYMNGEQEDIDFNYKRLILK